MIEEIQSPSKRIWLKTISMVLVVTFLHQQVLWGMDFNSLLQKRERAVLSERDIDEARKGLVYDHVVRFILANDLAHADLDYKRLINFMARQGLLPPPQEGEPALGKEEAARQIEAAVAGETIEINVPQVQLRSEAETKRIVEERATQELREEERRREEVKYALPEKWRTVERVGRSILSAFGAWSPVKAVTSYDFANALEDSVINLNRHDLRMVEQAERAIDQAPLTAYGGPIAYFMMKAWKVAWEIAEPRDIAITGLTLFKNDGSTLEAPAAGAHRLASDEAKLKLRVTLRNNEAMKAEGNLIVAIGNVSRDDAKKMAEELYPGDPAAQDKWIKKFWISIDGLGYLEFYYAEKGYAPASERLKYVVGLAGKEKTDVDIELPRLPGGKHSLAVRFVDKYSEMPVNMNAQIGAYDVDKLSNGDPDKKTALKTALVNAGFGVATDEDKKLLKAAGIADPGLIPRVIDVGKDLVEVRAIAGPHTTTVSKVTGAEVNTVSTAESYFAQLKLAGTEEARRLVIENFDADEFLKSAFNSGDKRYINEFARKKQGLRDELIRCADLYSNAWTVVDKSRVEARFEKYLKENFSIPRGMEVPITAVVENIGDVQDGIYAYIVTVTDTSTHKVAQRIGYASIKRGPDNKATITFTIKLNKNGDYAGNIAFFPADFLKGDYKDVRDVLSGRGYFKFRVGQLKPQDFTITDAYMPQGVETDKGEIHTVIMATIQNKGKADRAVYIEATDQIVGEETEIIHTSRGITIPAGKSMKIAIPVKLKQGEHTIALALVDSTSEIGDPLMVPTKKPDGTIQHKPLRKLMRVTADTGLLKAYRFEKGPDGKEKRVYLGADEKIGINLRVKGQQHEAMPFFSDAYIQGAQGKKVRLRVRVVNISSPGQVESSFDSEPVNIPSEKRDFKISIPLEKFVELEEGKFKLSYELYEVDPQGSETMLFGMEDNNVFENRVMKVIERSEVTVLPLAKEKAAVQLNKEEDALIKKAASRGVERAYLEREAAPLFLETARQDINRQDDRKALFDKVEEDLKQRMPLSNRDLIDAENLGMDEVVFRNAVWDSPETGAGLDQIVRNVIENRNRELKEKGVEIRNEMQQKVEEQEKDVEARTEAEKLRQGRLERTLNFLNWKVLGSAFGILFLIGLLRKGFRARREARQRRRTSGAVVQLEVEKAQAAVRGDMVAVDQRQQQIDALLDYPQASGAGAVDYKFIELLDNIIGGRGQGETFFVQGDLEQILKTIKGLVDKQKKSGLTRGETKKLVKQKEMLVQVLACINMLSNRREAARRILLSNPKLMGLNNPMLPRTLVEMILRLRRSRVSSMRGVGYLLALGLVTVQSFGAAREFIASTFGVRKMLSLRLDANTAKSWKTFITLKTELSWIQYVIHVWGRWLNGHFLMAAEAYQGGAVYLKPQNISELEEKLLGTPTYDLERKQLTVMGLAAALKRQGYGVAASWLGRKKQERNNYYLWGSSVPIKGMTYVGSTKDLEMFIAQGSWDSAERILTAMGTRGGRTTAGLVLMGPGAGGVEYIMVNDQLWQLEAARPAPKDCNNSTGLQFFFGDITIVVPKTSGSLRGNKTDWADIEIQPGTDIKVPSSMLVLAAAVMDNGVQAEDVGNILRRRHLRDKRRFRAGIARQAGGSVAARAGNFYRQLNDIRLPQLIGYNINAASVRVVNERLLTMEDTLSLRLDVIVRMLAELGIGVVPANMDDVREYFAKLYWQLNDRQRNSVWAWIEQNVKAGDFVRTRIQTRFVDGNDPSLNQDWRNAIKSGRINPFEVLAGCVVTSDVFDARLSRLDFVIKLMKSVYEVRNFGRMWAGLIQRESEKPGAVGRNGVVLGGDTTGMGVANALRDYSGPSAAAANRQRQLAQIQRSLAAAQAQLGQIEAQGAGYLSYQERTKLEIAAKGLRQRISGLNERITAMTTEIAQLPCSDCRAVFEAGAYRDAMDRLKQFGREHKSDGDALSTLSRALSLSGRVFGLSATVNGNTVPLSPLAYAQDPDNPALTNEERACLVNEYMSLYRQQIAYTAETGAGRISETIRTLDEILYAALTTAKGQGSAVDEAFPGFQLADLRKHYFPALTPSEDRIETSRDGDGALEREREKFREEIARINGHAVLQITVGNQTMSFEMVKGERGFYYYPGSLRRLKNRLIEIRTGRTSAMGDEVSPEQIGRLQEGGVPASAFGWIKDPLFMSIGAWYKPEDVIKDAKKRIDREIDTAAAQAASSRLAASGSGETVAIGNIHLPVIGPLASSQAGGGLSWLEIERHIDNFTNNPDIPGNLIALVQVADMEERLGLPDQAHAILGTLADRVVSGTLLAANLERYQSLKYTHNLRELLEREGIYFSLADEEIEAGMRSGLYPLETIADYVNMLNLLELRKTRDRWSRMAGLDAQAGRRLYGIGRECELGLALLMTKEALSRIAKHCPDPQAVALAAQAIGALPQERNDMAQAIVYDEMLEALCVGSWMAGWTYCGSNSKRALRGGDVAVPNTHPRLDLWERVVGKVFGDTTFGFKRSWYRYSPAVSTGDLQPARLRGECTVPFMPLEGIENQTLAQVINVLDAVCKKEGVFAETIIPYVLENNRPRPPKEGDKGIQVVVVYKTRDGLRDADRVGVLNNNVLPQVRELVPAACGINFAFTALSREEFRIAAETRFDGILRNEALRPLLNMIGLARSAYIEYKKTKEERGWRAILLGLRNRLERYAPEETLAQPSSFFQSIIRVFLSDAGSKSVLDVICKEARKLALKDPALSNMMAGNGQLLMNVVRMIFMTEPLIVDLARENVRRPLASFGIDAPGDMTCATLLAVADKHTKDMKERILNSEGLINPERITRGQELDKMNYPELLSLCQDHSLQDESPLKKNIRDAIRGGLIIYKVSGLQGWLNAPDGAAADVHPADWAPKHSRLEPNTDTLMDMMADWSRGYVSDGLMTYISGLRSLARRARDGDQAAAAELTARIRQRNAYINQEGLRSYGAARVQVLREGRMWNEWPEEGDEAIYFILRNVRLLSQRAQATGRVELLNKRDVAAQFANIYNSFINRFGADYEARQDAVRAFRSYYEAVEQLYQIQLASGKISDEEKTRLRENLAVLQSRLQQISGQTDTELAALIAGLPQMTEERLRSGELELPEGVEGLVMAMVHSQILDREAGLSEDMQTLMNLFSPCPRIQRLGLYDMGRYWAMFPLIPIAPGKPLARIPLIPKPFFDTRFSVPERTLPVVGVRFLLGMSPLAACLGGFSRSLFSQASESFWVLVEDTAYGIYAGGRNRRTRPILDPFTPGVAMLTAAVARLTKEEEDHSDSVIRAFSQFMYEHGIMESQRDMSRSPVDGAYLVGRGFIGAYDAAAGQWETEGVFNHILACQSVQRHNDEREMGTAGFMDYFGGGFSWGQLWGSPVSVFPPGIGRAYRDGRKFDDLDKTIPFKLAELYLRISLQENPDLTGGLYPVDPDLAACFANWYPREVIIAAILRRIGQLNVSIGSLNVPDALRQEIQGTREGINRGEIQIDSERAARLETEAREYCRAAQVDEYQTGPVQPVTADKLEIPVSERYWREINAVYTLFNVPTIVTSDKFKELTSAQQEGEMDRGIRQEIREAEAAGREPQFTQAQKDRIELRRKPLWERFIDGVRAVRWREMIPGHPHISFALKLGFLLGAGILLCTFLIPLPLLLFFVAVAGLPLVGKFGDIHRAGMQLVPESYPPWARRLISITLRVAILIGILLLFKYGALTSSIDLGFIKLDWNVLATKWLWNKVFIGFMVKHCFIYILTAKFASLLLPRFERWVRARLETLDFTNTRLYRWYTDSRRSNFTHNMGYAVSKVMLMAFDAYAIARVGIRFGAELFDLTGLPRFFRRRTPAQQPPQAPPPPAPAQPPAPAPMPVPEPAPAQPPAPAPMPVPEPAPAQPPAPAPAHPEETPPAAGPQTYEDVMRAEAIEARDTTRAQLDNTRRFIEHGEFEAARSVINRIGEPIATVEAAGIVLKDDGLEADALSMRQEVKGIIAQVKADIQQNLTGAEGLITAAGEDMADQRQDDASAKMTRANILLIKAQNSSVMLKKDDPLLERLAEVNEMFSTVDAQLAVVEITVTQPPPPGPGTPDIEDQARSSHEAADDVLREASFAETTSNLPSAICNLSLRSGQGLRRFTNPSLIIGIPETIHTPEVCKAVRQKLAAMGRSDVLVIPIDRDQMQTKLEESGVPFGVILDVDNIENIDNLLEPFMEELDLQGLFRDYPGLIKMTGIAEIKKRITEIKINRDVLIMIARDQRLLPKIASLNLEYVFSNSIDGYCNRYPVRKDVPKPKAGLINNIDLFIDRQKQKFNLCNLCLNLRNRKK